MSRPLPVAGADPCACDGCKAQCRRACWPIPSEARRLIEQGYAERLMLDHWVAEPYVYVVCPAEKGSEGDYAPSWPGHGCVMQDAAGLCRLHDLGLKPAEGRLARCANSERPTPSGLHRDVADTWDSQEGRDVVALWCRATGRGSPY